MPEEAEPKRAHTKQQQQEEDDEIRRKLSLSIRGGLPLPTIRGIVEEALACLPRENEKGEEDEDETTATTATTARTSTATTATETRSRRLRDLLMGPPPPPPLSPAASTTAATPRGTPSDDTSVGTTTTAATTPLLLHEALRHGATIDVVKYLADACPESLRVWGRYYERFGEGCHGLALHLAILYKGSEWPWTTGGTGGTFEGAEYLLQKWPEAAREWTRPAAATTSITTASRHRGNLPLHLFLEASAGTSERLRRHGDDFLLRLLRANPQALHERECRHGRLPLNVALENEYPPITLSLETVRAIVEPYPEAVRLRDDDPEGRLALHAAVERWDPPFVPPDVLAYLLDLHPESVRERTLRTGELPLHLAAASAAKARRDDPAPIRALIERWPESVRERDADGRLPVHRAVIARGGPWLGSLRALVDPWPASLMERDKERCLPIHQAAVRSHPTEIVRFLVERSPDSVLVGDGRGRIALHLAAGAAAAKNSTRLWDGAYLGTVDYLIEARPESVLIADARGDLPVHLMLRADPWQNRTDVVARLLEASPAAARVANRAGQLPLHLATNRRRWSLPLVRVVTEAWRGALRVPDNEGRFPLHVAMAHHNAELVEYLVTERPESLSEVDPRGNLPLHFALARSAPHPIVRLLVERHPEALQRRGADGLLPVQFALHLKNNVKLETSRFLAEAHPAALQQVDASGRTALHMMLDRRPAPPLPFVTAMIQLGPGAVQVRDVQGLLPVHVAAHRGAHVDVIYNLVRLRPDLL